MNLNYSLNGVTFSSLRIYVESSEGLIDGLSRKEPLSVDWPDAHGQVVDLSRPRFEARTIRLNCWMVALSADSLLFQLNSLKAELMKGNTQRLMLTPVAGKPLVYEVYFSGGLSVEKQWRDGQMFARFTLSLIEPQPMKWVLSASGGVTASMRLTAATPVVFHWGDGTKTEFMGTNQTVSHTYGGNGPYYLIISGELERMGFHEAANLTEIWQRLY